jgi:hypothetical protein
VIWDALNQNSLSGFGGNSAFIYEQRTPNGEIVLNHPVSAVNINPSNPNPNAMVIVGTSGNINTIGLNGEVNTYNIQGEVRQINQVDKDGSWVLGVGTSTSAWNYFVFA